MKSEKSEEADRAVGQDTRHRHNHEINEKKEKTKGKYSRACP